MDSLNDMTCWRSWIPKVHRRWTPNWDVSETPSEMIASENFVPRAVLQAQGSV